MSAASIYRPELFDLPEGVVYLDGNSLGPLPRCVPARVAAAVTDEWGGQLVRGWNDAGWFDLADRAAARIAPLIGAAPECVTVADSTSVNLFKLLSAALRMNPDRRVILSEEGNFPTDLYVAQGLSSALGQEHRLLCLPREQIVPALAKGDVAVLMLTQVDYRTGARHDMAAVTRAAHEAGTLVIWDLAHSAGAFPVDLGGADADFAIGCGYKFLNGGPGAPAFAYVAPRHHAALAPALTGWIGHAAPFDFDPDYRPAEGVARLKIGTPPILSMTALEAALGVFEDVDMPALRRKSQELCDHLIREVEARCPDLRLATPRAAEARGSQVSFRHPEGYAIMQALISEGVIGDFRAPDILRFGITPLYIDEGALTRAAETLERIMAGALWDREEFRRRARVT